MMAMRRKAAVVIFGACLSGLGGSSVNSEFSGFTHVVLETGALAFMGTLWEVSDVATTMLTVLLFFFFSFG